MGLSPEEDRKRKPVDLALAAGKKRISPQTGFVHLYSERPTALRQDTIPVIENWLYAYALFRSKLSENILEAKELIEKLSGFECNGNFPVYFHEFPVCKDAQLSSRCLPIVFYLLRDFSGVLGEAFCHKLTALSERIVDCLERQPRLGRGAQSRLSAFLGRFQPSSSCRSLSELADECICLQMSGASLASVAALWDPFLCIYTGSLKDREQDRTEPAVSLLDLFMGEFFRHFSRRALESDRVVHLQAALVHPCVTSESFSERPSCPFRTVSQEGSKERFILYWGGMGETHSLVFEADRGSVSSVETEEGFDLSYSYDEEIPSEEEGIESAFYLNASEAHSLSVSEQKATVFHPEDSIRILSDSVTIELRFFPKEVRWMGHISKGNRFSQRNRDLPYECYDWKIGLRTLRREASAGMVVQVKIKPKSP